jgi:hypothetical protein
MQSDRLFIVVLLILGFIWLRRRGRHLDEAARGRALLGTVFLLIPGVIGVRWVAERLTFSHAANVAVEILLLAALLAIAGFGIMRPKRD